ncbi:DUF3048 domain-containing protein [Nocardioides sediminis]|uniref:DUF3048 domain-containing protein n=1 Tax=Nocardioides sediminis TaxID=433648 RepID=UPI000D30F1D5|nr:DUF3048 domain-containing protein [Nocardioides sediminis]
MLPRPPRLRLGVATLAAATLLLAGCGGDEEPASTPEPTSDATSETTAAEPEEPALWPLTGLPMEGEAPRNPVIVTKVDNTSSSAPQVGLGQADMVVEELVEGGMTRLAAFYYSRLPQVVGPVRSMRASDIGIVPTGAHVVTSGAAPVTLGRVRQAGIPFVTEGAKGVYRDNGRSAPYNLFADLKAISGAIKGGDAPDPYLAFGEEGDAPGGKPARTLSAAFGGHTTTWQFQGGKYVNTNSYAATGDEFPATTVLALRVQVGDAGYRDPAGYPVPETKFEGKGQALLFHGGKVVRGTWSKDGLTGALKLTGPKGGEITVPPGRTWVELVPVGSGNVTWSK